MFSICSPASALFPNLPASPSTIDTFYKLATSFHNTPGSSQVAQVSPRHAVVLTRYVRGCFILRFQSESQCATIDNAASHERCLNPTRLPHGILCLVVVQVVQTDDLPGYPLPDISFSCPAAATTVHYPSPLSIIILRMYLCAAHHRAACLLIIISNQCRIIPSTSSPRTTKRVEFTESSTYAVEEELI